MEIMFLVIGIAVGIMLGFFIGISKYKHVSSKLEERNTLVEKSLEETKGELVIERKTVMSLTSELSEAKTNNKNLENKLSEQNSEFQNLASIILKDVSKELSDTNKNKLADILNPLKDKIENFEKQVNAVYKTEADERNVLKGEINKLVEFNKKISEGAENLANALKGDKKKQGDWGEDRLEILLQKAGLKKDIHYKKQESLRDDEGGIRRLDFIINLPDNKSLIIDSKVSLNDYTNYYNAENDEDRNMYLKNYLKCIYDHVDELSSRKYHELYGINSPEYVLMYIPIEPAFYLAVENDNELFLWALEKKNIILVTTTNLLPTLSTVSFIWSQENQKRNVLEIAKQSGALYDKFVGFVKDLKEIGEKIDSSKESYSEAMKKLYDGAGNLVNRVENIKKLGAKTNKSIDQRILDRANDDDDELKLIQSS